MGEVDVQVCAEVAALGAGEDAVAVALALAGSI